MIGGLLEARGHHDQRFGLVGEPLGGLLVRRREREHMPERGGGPLEPLR